MKIRYSQIKIGNKSNKNTKYTNVLYKKQVKEFYK